MNELLSAGLWPRLRQLAKKAHKKHAAIAYVTDDRSVAFGKGDVLVTDASDGAIKSGQTSAAVLRAALKRGAEIVSIAGLHSKLYVFDRYVIVGSANLSKGSERRIETALFTDQPATVSESRLLIERLKGEGKRVNEAFVARISKIPVLRMTPMPVAGKRLLRGDKVSRTWLVGLTPTEEKKEERALVEEGRAEARRHVSDEDSEVSWIRFRGNSRFRREGQAGDSVVGIWSKNSTAKPDAVYRHSPILFRKEVRGQTFFYIEDYPDSETTSLTWKQFQRLYSKIGVIGKLGKSPVRELAHGQSELLHALWDGPK